jgi:4-amino-4-deoxy-L-arabinose transferase-like glycosyltransferase
MKAEARLVLLCTLLSAVLATLEIGRPSYWIDEKISVDIASAAAPDQVVRNVIEDERRPPAYHLSLWLWLTATGGHERMARLHSALWAILAVPAAYQLARRVSSGKAAVCAALLAALSPILIAFGQTVRYYTMVATLGALSYILFLDVMRRQPGRKPWLAYALATLALLYCDFPAYGVVLAQNALAVLWWRDRRSFPNHPRARWLAAQAVLAAAALLWLPVVLEQGARDFGAADLSGSLAGAALKIAYPFYAWLVGENLFPWSPLAIAGGLAAGALLIFGFLRLRGAWSRAFWAVAFLAPFATAQALLGTVATDSPFVNAPARAMACLPLIWAAVGVGAAALPRRALTAAALGVLALAYAAGLSNYYRGVDFINAVYDTPAREVAAAVQAGARPGDAVVSESDTLVSHYLPPQLAQSHFTPDQIDALDAYLDAHPRASVWLVAMGRDRTRNELSSRLAARLRERYRHASSAGFAEQDPTYRALKSRLLGREAYRYRLTLDAYAPQPASP